MKSKAAPKQLTPAQRLEGIRTELEICLGDMRHSWSAAVNGGWHPQVKNEADAITALWQDILYRIKFPGVYFLDDPLLEAELSVRTYNCLKDARINTFRDLVFRMPAELLKIKNFGRKCLNEIQELLKDMSLALNMPPPPPGI